MSLHDDIKQLIIDSLNLEGMTIDDIDTDAPLFNEGLGLDSIDALELGLAIKNHFNIVLSSNTEDNKAYFASVATLADYIASHHKEP
ncbi:phosphopantetheine-binding protein [Wohlfahrtiimonas chitiniclastica]|uniref:Carrier domain-containing protein n=2 Tax=Wohlfahrtiimonas chitiniclastica TaxID=400946 RepID=L8XVJ8_9GAMM|nr:phosphopantetheine-binding protein [Wohlfahrtiimonas chitiniclastica]ELV08038.1 Hypothetical protein F387_00767 [Wohlfahrtiimonas chitiniclastica SH04]KZS23780.1 hypothetical protein BMY_1650 [Wohlfahrtiimonas chitiniclastica]KZX36557.1 acyl carrier protein [Wohlfahrtiimonas chitiniclastica]MBS7818407.1 acyl carrier protein [Wohlfahrtiimonas chitiniclastica]MBS7820327.1 acyl carrier protein [Wohlfahrtiimonas chitiniclastica]